jgi:hypothetical protein
MSTAITTAITSLVAAQQAPHVCAHYGDEPAATDYGGPVATGAGMNPAAHGAESIIETCSCRMIRYVNVRGDEREEGAWESGSEAFAAYWITVSKARALGRAAKALEEAVETDGGGSAKEMFRLAVAPALAELKASLKPVKRQRVAAALNA